MLDRYDQFSTSISNIYKTIQKIKRDESVRYGLKGPHVQCLVTMRRCREGVIISQLCEMCDLDKAAVSRTVSELEEMGLIEREAEGDKLYRAPLRLTDKGQEIAGKISGLVEKAVELAGQGLTDDDRLVFYRSLELIAGNLQRISREGVLHKDLEGTNIHE